MSPSHHFPCLPPQAFHSFGGYTWVKPEEWHGYLKRTIRTRFPGYSLPRSLRQHTDRPWLENNCIYSSISKYLLLSFGYLVPEESLFQFFNRQGEGVSVPEIIEAILSVIEPLDFKIEKVLVPDPELRGGLGYAELVFDITYAAAFHRQAGLCMINVRDGYSHAFFWKEMDQAKFSKEQFRLAVLLRPKKQNGASAPSVQRCLEEFHRLLLSALPLGKNTALLQSEIECLDGYIHEAANRESSDYDLQVERRLESILACFHHTTGPGLRKRSPQVKYIAEVGKMVCRIIRECRDI